jgi:hypothetical protein
MSELNATTYPFEDVYPAVYSAHGRGGSAEMLIEGNDEDSSITENTQDGLRALLDSQITRAMMTHHDLDPRWQSILEAPGQIWKTTDTQWLGWSKEMSTQMSPEPSTPRSPTFSWSYAPEIPTEQEFRHDRLDYEMSSIRILEVLPELSQDGLIQCVIRHSDISDKYCCLSYMWGPQPPLPAYILINSKHYPVRENLLRFLKVRRPLLPTWFR